MHVGELMGVCSVLARYCSSWADTLQTPPTQVFLQLHQEYYLLPPEQVAQLPFALGPFLTGNSASSIKMNKDLHPGSKEKHPFQHIKTETAENNASELDSGFRQTLGLNLGFHTFQLCELHHIVYPSEPLFSYLEEGLISVYHMGLLWGINKIMYVR